MPDRSSVQATSWAPLTAPNLCKINSLRACSTTRTSASDRQTVRIARLRIRPAIAPTNRRTPLATPTGSSTVPPASHISTCASASQCAKVLNLAFAPSPVHPNRPTACLQQATHPRLPPANALPHPPNQFFAPTIAPNSSQFHCQACSRASCTCTTQDKRFNGSPSFATEDDNSLLRTDLQYSLPQTSCSRT
jgi:hypothetical protein